MPPRREVARRSPAVGRGTALATTDRTAETALGRFRFPVRSLQWSLSIDVMFTIGRSPDAREVRRGFCT